MEKHWDIVVSTERWTVSLQQGTAERLTEITGITGEEAEASVNCFSAKRTITSFTKKRYGTEFVFVTFTDIGRWM